MLVSSYPTFYPGNVLPEAACDSHPTTGYGAHKDPIEGGSIILTKDGEEVTSFCPGESYNVTLSLDEEDIMGMMTSSVGTFTEPAPDCPTRVTFASPAAEHVGLWTAPCDDDVEEVTVKTTCTTSPSSAYNQATATVPVADDCEDVCS